MARYFIDSLLGDDLIEDTEGFAFSTFAEAEAAALSALSDMGREMPRTHRAMMATVILHGADRAVLMRASLKLEIDREKVDR